MSGGLVIRILFDSEVLSIISVGKDYSDCLSFPSSWVVGIQT